MFGVELNKVGWVRLKFVVIVLIVIFLFFIVVKMKDKYGLIDYDIVYYRELVWGSVVWEICYICIEVIGGI